LKIALVSKQGGGETGRSEKGRERDKSEEKKRELQIMLEGGLDSLRQQAMRHLKKPREGIPSTGSNLKTSKRLVRGKERMEIGRQGGTISMEEKGQAKSYCRSEGRRT